MAVYRAIYIYNVLQTLIRTYQNVVTNRFYVCGFKFIILKHLFIIGIIVFVFCFIYHV